MATSIRLTEDVEQRLVTFAVRTGRTKAHHLREPIEKGLEDLEDYDLAADTMERVGHGEEVVSTLHEVERELDLAD